MAVLYQLANFLKTEQPTGLGSAHHRGREQTACGVGQWAGKFCLQADGWHEGGNGGRAQEDYAGGITHQWPSGPLPKGE